MELNKTNWTPLHNFVWDNQTKFIGMVKTSAKKIPVKKESKKLKWLFNDTTNPRAERVLEVIRWHLDDPENRRMGVLLDNSIMVVDADNKQHDGRANGVERWIERSGMQMMHRSNGGSGMHLFLNNPLNQPLSTSLKAATGFPDDIEVEFFSGHKQFIVLPQWDDIQWQDIDLANLNGTMPLEFVTPAKKPKRMSKENFERANKVTMSDTIVQVALYASRYDVSDYDGFTTFTMAMSNLASMPFNADSSAAIYGLWNHFTDNSADNIKYWNQHYKTDIGQAGIAMNHLRNVSKMPSYRLLEQEQYDNLINLIKQVI